MRSSNYWQKQASHRLFTLSLQLKISCSSVTFRKQKWQPVWSAATPSRHIKARGGWLLGADRAGEPLWSWENRKHQNESWCVCPYGVSFSPMQTHWPGCIYARLAPLGWDLIANCLIHFFQMMPSPMICWPYSFSSAQTEQRSHHPIWSPSISFPAGGGTSSITDGFCSQLWKHYGGVTKF